MIDLPLLDRAMTPEERRALKKLGSVVRRRGHAADPGTGPSDQKCGTCAHLFRSRTAKVYLKCNLMRQHWTGGCGTDVRAKDAACSRWTPITPSETEK